MALFLATIFVYIVRPFYHGHFGNAFFRGMGDLLGVGWFKASCHSKCCFPLIYVSFIMPTVSNFSISVGDMLRPLREVSLEYSVFVTSAVIAINTCLDSRVSALFAL